MGQRKLPQNKDRNAFRNRYYNKIQVNQTSAYNAGHTAGYNAGHTAGHNSGYTEGVEVGKQQAEAILTDKYGLRFELCSMTGKNCRQAMGDQYWSDNAGHDGYHVFCKGCYNIVGYSGVKNGLYAKKPDGSLVPAASNRDSYYIIQPHYHVYMNGLAVSSMTFLKDGVPVYLD